MVHELVLVSEPASAKRARDFVASCLRRQGYDGWAESAVLCTSELVTNAILHARTQLRLRVDLRATSVRVEVVDRSRMPVPLSDLETAYESSDGNGLLGDAEVSMTGRGWLLVSSLAQRYGVGDVPDGKVAWFELLFEAGDGSERVADVGGNGSPDVAIPDKRMIEMLDVPARLVIASEQHLADLFREAQLALAATGSRVSSAGQRVASVMQEILDRYAGVRSVGWSLSIQAISDGRETISFTFHLPPEAEQDARTFDTLLTEADELCRRGELLTMPASDELSAFRRWCIDEAIRQLHEMSPQVCPFDR